MRDRSPETQRLLRRCYQESQQHRVRQRAHCILLSLSGKTATELLHIFHGERLPISHGFDAWERCRFAGRYDHAKCGRPPKLTEAEQEQVQHSLTQPPHTMKKGVHLIEQATAKRVSTHTMKRLRKKTARSGNGSSTHQRRAQIRRNMSAVKP